MVNTLVNLHVIYLGLQGGNSTWGCGYDTIPAKAVSSNKHLPDRVEVRAFCKKGSSYPNQ